MMVLKISAEKFDRIAGFHTSQDRIIPQRDANGNDVIGMNSLFNPAFAQIMSELEQLEAIEFVPYDDITDEEIEILQARNQELLANYFINNPDLGS